MTKYHTHADSDYGDLIKDLKSGRQDRLEEVYQDHRDAFLAWAMSRFACNQDEATEVFQDVMLAFYENVMAGKIDSLNSQLRTYLFGIGRFLLLKQFRARQRWVRMDDQESLISIPEHQLPGRSIEAEDRSDIVRQSLEALGENCRELLIRVYYHRLSGDIIASQLGYKNADVVKSQKSRCMKQLRSLIRHQFDSEDL